MKTDKFLIFNKKTSIHDGSIHKSLNHILKIMCLSNHLLIYAVLDKTLSTLYLGNGYRQSHIRNSQIATFHKRKQKGSKEHTAKTVITPTADQLKAIKIKSQPSGSVGDLFVMASRSQTSMIIIINHT